jgi:hypothetical protein
VDRAKEELAAQIKTVLEPGYKSRNPILDAVGLITLEASKDPTQRTLATLTREVQNLRGDFAAVLNTLNTVQNRSSALSSPNFFVSFKDFPPNALVDLSSEDVLRNIRRLQEYVRGKEEKLANIHGSRENQNPISRGEKRRPEPDRDREQKEDKRSEP